MVSATNEYPGLSIGATSPQTTAYAGDFITVNTTIPNSRSKVN
jgi:hypothetical protein